MKCEKCNNNEATIHLTEIVKNVKTELHLCERCARQAGINSRVSNFSLSLHDMLSFIDLAELKNNSTDIFCSRCGMSFSEYKKSGTLGCPRCYQDMKTNLLSFMKSIHGFEYHTGKAPSHFVEPDGNNNILLTPNPDNFERKEASQISELIKQLDSAVLHEHYEEAAILRDRIRELEKSRKN
jgi:protein arginine kinase activator